MTQPELLLSMHCEELGNRDGSPSSFSGLACPARLDGSCPQKCVGQARPLNGNVIT